MTIALWIVIVANSLSVLFGIFTHRNLRDLERIQRATIKSSPYFDVVVDDRAREVTSAIVVGTGPRDGI